MIRWLECQPKGNLSPGMLEGDVSRVGVEAPNLWEWGCFAPCDFSIPLFLRCILSNKLVNISRCFPVSRSSKPSNPIVVMNVGNTCTHILFNIRKSTLQRNLFSAKYAEVFQAKYTFYCAPQNSDGQGTL